MATFPISLPTQPGFEEAELTLVRSTNITQSPFTGAAQKSEQPFSLWVFKSSVPLMEESRASEWRAILTELRGQVGTFKLIVPGYSGPSTGYSGSAGLVKGVSQLGTSLITDSWDISIPLFNRGDYFTINNELKVITTTISSDGIGEATIDFEPALRSSPPDNDPFVIVDPFVVMRMSRDDLGWAIRHPVLSSIVVEAVEDF